MASGTVNTELSIVGAKEALRELNKMDRVARRQVTKDYAMIVETVITEARALTPSEPPLSGMKYTWKPQGRRRVFPYNGARADQRIVPFVSGKKPRKFGAYTSNLTTFGIRWTEPSSSVIEMSGKGKVPTARGQQMVRALNQRYGTPGRFLWKAYESHKEDVERRVGLLMKDVMRQIQRKI